jgi:hypothetical protein
MMIETADSITMRYSLARGVAPATVLCNVLAVSEHLQLGWGISSHRGNANKTARIAWAVMLREKEYQPRAMAA